MSSLVDCAGAEEKAVKSAKSPLVSEIKNTEVWFLGLVKQNYFQELLRGGCIKELHHTNMLPLNKVPFLLYITLTDLRGLLKNFLTILALICTKNNEQGASIF